LQSLSIGNRILLGFAGVLVVMVAMGLYSLGQLAEVRDTTELVVSRNVTMLRELANLREVQARAQDAREAIVTRGLLTTAGHPLPASTDLAANWRRDRAAVEDLIARSTKTAATMREQALTSSRADAWRRIGDVLQDLATDARQINEVSDRQIAAVAAGDLAAVASADAPIAAGRENFTRRASVADEIMNGAVASGQQRIANVYEESRVSILIGFAIAVLVAIAIATLIRGTIVSPLTAFMRFTERVGAGDLEALADTNGPLEIRSLGAMLNKMVEGLRQLTRQNREVTENLNAAAAEIRASTQEQAASVEEQLAAVQETAATVDEITHAGAQIGRRAQEVIATAQATAQTSNAGLKAVEDTAKAMDSIREQAEIVAQNIVSLSEKTQAIEEITATVNDISERSHLLALNAAIEAAGAGESGNRFAVVAAEMKMLADQAKEATAQVRGILGEIQRGINSSVMLTEEAVKRVAAGKERTDTTQQTIEEITGRVQESVQTFQQIIASTNQQQLGIEQVMTALQNIRQASQQTAAGTRQLDTAAGNLSRLSQQLLTLTERYRT
jgi:methyl-accepting chemotaxis protein